MNLWIRGTGTINYVDQRFPTWGTCTPRGTFACLQGYIYCTAATN